MRIDAHHHLWSYSPATFGWIAQASALARDFSGNDLSYELAAAGIDGAIAVQARQTDEETAFLLAAVQATPSIIGVVGWIDLCAPDVAATIAARRTRRLVGYRHIVQDEPDPQFLLDDDFVHGVRAALTQGLAYDLLVNPAHLGTVPAFLDRVGSGRVILDHAAKPDIRARTWQPWADRIAAIAAFPHVYCKLSGLVTEADHRDWRPADIEPYLEYLAAVFGPQRLIWGSDWPVCLLAAEYRGVFDLVADFVRRHCPEAEGAIFGVNAMRAYALDDAPPGLGAGVLPVTSEESER